MPADSIGKAPMMRSGRFWRVDSVERRKNQVDGSRGFEGDSMVSRSRISPTRITLGCLTECTAKRSRKRRRTLGSSAGEWVVFVGDGEIRWGLQW